MMRFVQPAAIVGLFLGAGLAGCANSNSLVLTASPARIPGGASSTITFMPKGVSNNPLFTSIAVGNTARCGSIAPATVASNVNDLQPTATFTAGPNTGKSNCIETITGTTATTVAQTASVDVHVLPGAATASPLSSNRAIITLQPDIAPPVWAYGFSTDSDKIERIIIALEKPCPAPVVTTPPVPAIRVTISPAGGQSANWAIAFAPDTEKASITFNCPGNLETIGKAKFEVWVLGVANKTLFAGIPGPK